MAERLGGYEAPARPVGPGDLPRVPDGPAQGAVRRTPRPTGDRQTPETVAQPGAGTTQTGGSVSRDAENATGDLSPEVAAALIERHGPEIEALAELAQHGLDQLRGKIHATAVLGHLHTTDDDMQAFVELSDCEACGGTGKDDHATPFEQPLAVHFAAPEIELATVGRLRQLCLWCGHVLLDVPLANAPKPWPPASLVRIEDGVPTIEPYEPGDPLPPGCCALPDDEPPSCTCGPDRCHRLDVNGQCQHCARIGPGQGGCPADNGRAWTLGDHPADRPPADGWDGVAARATEVADALAADPEVYREDVEGTPDEAQETRAADWPAEPQGGDRCGAGCGNGPEDICWHSEED